GGPPVVPLLLHVGAVLLGGALDFFFTVRRRAATARHRVDRATVSPSRFRSSARVASGCWRTASHSASVEASQLGLGPWGPAPGAASPGSRPVRVARRG